MKKVIIIVISLAVIIGIVYAVSYTASHTEGDIVQLTDPKDEIKAAAEDGIGEGESIDDISINDKNLTITVTISEESEDHAKSRFGSITDEILNVDDFNSVKIIFTGVGSITGTSDQISDGPAGKYFDTEKMGGDYPFIGE